MSMSFFGFVRQLITPDPQGEDQDLVEEENTEAQVLQAKSAYLKPKTKDLKALYESLNGHSDIDVDCLFGPLKAEMNRQLRSNRNVKTRRRKYDDVMGTKSALYYTGPLAQKHGKKNEGRDVNSHGFTDTIIMEYIRSLSNEYREVAYIDLTHSKKTDQFLETMRTKQTHYFKRLREKLTAAETIIFPLYIDKGQFGLLILAENEDEGKGYYDAYCLDPLNWIGKHEDHLRFAEDLLKILHGNKTVCVKHNVTVPEQIGRVDSGPAVCFFAKAFLEEGNIDEYINFAQEHGLKCDYSPFRYDIAHAIDRQRKAEAQAKVHTRFTPNYDHHTDLGDDDVYSKSASRKLSGSPRYARPF